MVDDLSNERWMKVKHWRALINSKFQFHTEIGKYWREQVKVGEAPTLKSNRKPVRMTSYHDPCFQVSTIVEKELTNKKSTRSFHTNFSTHLPRWSDQLPLKMYSFCFKQHWLQQISKLWNFDSATPHSLWIIGIQCKWITKPTRKFLNGRLGAICFFFFLSFICKICYKVNK